MTDRTAEKGTRFRAWLRGWWVTLRYGSPLTEAGRTLRRNVRDDLSEYVEVECPTLPADCNWTRCRSPQTGKCFAWCKCRCHAAALSPGRAATEEPTA